MPSKSRNHDIYMKRACDLHEKIVRSRYRVLDQHEELLRSSWKDHEIYMKRAWINMKIALDQHKEIMIFKCRDYVMEITRV